MPVFEAVEVPTITPEAVVVAYQIFERYYSHALETLPSMGLRWRIDVETREPGQSPEQQHQVVIWDPKLRNSYGLRLWLREDGTLDSLVGDRLTASALLSRVQRYQASWLIDQQAEQRDFERRVSRAHELREAAYLLATVAVALAGLAWILFGRPTWIAASLDTAGLFVVMALVLDGWLRWFLHRARRARQPTKEAGWVSASKD